MDRILESHGWMGNAEAESLQAAQVRKAQPSLIEPRSLEGARVRLFIALMLIDAFSFAFGFIAADAVWLGLPLDSQGLNSLIAIFPIYFVTAYNNGSHSLTALERPLWGIAQSCKALLLASAVTIALLFSFKISDQFSRVVFMAGALSTLVTLMSLRWVVGNLAGTRNHWTFRNRLVIVDGVAVTPHPGDTIVLADQLGLQPGTDDPIQRQRLAKMLDRFDSVVLACPPEERRKWTYSLAGVSVDVELLMPELSRLGAIALRQHHGERTLVVSGRPMGYSDRVFKRALDIAVAGVALIALAPLMLLLAIAIRLDSPGPILFRQPRMGRNNGMFSVLKFRSMFAGSSDHNGNRSTSRRDSRVTAVGRFMRHTSLDELPQLFNVLLGEMSIVGPRPHALGSTAEDSLFWQIERRYFERHSIKPGITGLAQVRGFRGETARHADVTNRLQADLEYVAGWTIWRDLRIIAGTFLVLVHPKAY